MESHLGHCLLLGGHGIRTPSPRACRLPNRKFGDCICCDATEILFSQNLIKGGTLPGKSLVLAERLANQDLGNDVDKSSLSLWEPTEHVTWPMQTSPQRQSYQSVFLQGWQTPILVQLPVENVEDDPFLPVNESGFDSPLDLMIEQGPAHKRQRLQI